MRYKDVIVPALKDLEKKKAFIRGASARLAELKSRTPRPEDALDVLIERNYLEQKVRETEQDVRWLENGLRELTDEERLVLDKFFIHKKVGSVFDLMEELKVEQAQAYRLRETALVNLAKVLLGGAEL